MKPDLESKSADLEASAAHLQRWSGGETVGGFVVEVRRRRLRGSKGGRRKRRKRLVVGGGARSRKMMLSVVVVRVEGHDFTGTRIKETR